MADTDIDDSFEDDSFEDDADARLAEENDVNAKNKARSLEKRRLIDNLLEQKRLERSLKDGFDDIDGDLDDDLDFDDDTLED